MTTTLDEAVASLQAVLDQLQQACAEDVDRLWNVLLANGARFEDRAALIAALREYLPELTLAHAGAVAEVTAGWYEELAPGEPFSATVPDEIVPAERIATSVGWAINTATSIETALAQLQGTVQRAVLDAQRETVSHNASRERTRYRRHCGYAACNWCLVMAGRGAVYRSATSAVRGHDNCKCLAVPERAGMTEYTVPPLVRDAEKRYAEASKQLKAEGKPLTLAAVISRMDAQGA